MKHRYRYMPAIDGSIYHGWVIVSPLRWWQRYGSHWPFVPYFLPCARHVQPALLQNSAKTVTERL